MNTVRSTFHAELAIAGAMTLVARVVRTGMSALRSAVASQGPSPPVIFGRWSW